MTDRDAVLTLVPSHMEILRMIFLFNWEPSAILVKSARGLGEMWLHGSSWKNEVSPNLTEIALHNWVGEQMHRYDRGQILTGTPPSKELDIFLFFFCSIWSFSAESERSYFSVSFALPCLWACKAVSSKFRYFGQLNFATNLQGFGPRMTMNEH
jgi:hypothetical protein